MKKHVISLGKWISRRPIITAIITLLGWGIVSIIVMMESLSGFALLGVGLLLLGLLSMMLTSYINRDTFFYGMDLLNQAEITLSNVEKDRLFKAWVHGRISVIEEMRDLGGVDTNQANAINKFEDVYLREFVIKPWEVAKMVTEQNEQNN